MTITNVYKTNAIYNNSFTLIYNAPTMILIILKLGLFIPIANKIPCTAVNKPIKVNVVKLDLKANTIKTAITIKVITSGIKD